MRWRLMTDETLTFNPSSELGRSIIVRDTQETGV